MSRENVEIIRRGWEAYEGGDINAAIADMDRDMVTCVAPLLPVGGTYHGPEGFLQVTIDWAEGFDELEISAKEFVDAGDSVVVRAVHQSRGADSGVPVEAELWYVFTLRAGKVLRTDVFNEKSEALEAVGLRE
jgi:ketosteroid isomerase-like protein